MEELKGGLNSLILVCLGDILILSFLTEQHWDHLHPALIRLLEVKLYDRLRRCKSLKGQVDHVGSKISVS